MRDLVTALKAAAEPTRLRLLALCSNSDLTVSELTQILGQSQPRISRHLKLLHQARLLDRQREGSWVYFRLAGQGSSAELARILIGSMPMDDPIFALDGERLQQVFQRRTEKAAQYFGRNAKRWDQVRSLHVDEREVERVLLDLVLTRKVQRLLDIGTGTGRVLELLATRVSQLTGIDSSSEMLQVARANLARTGIRNCALRRCNMYQIPLPGRSFDAVTIHQVLHFAEAPEQVIAEASRLMAPGGRLFIIDFEEHHLDELREEHAHRWLGFKPATLQNWLAEAHLKPGKHLSLAGGALTVGVWTASKPESKLDSD